MSVAGFNLPENYTKREYFEQNGSTDGQMFFLTRHGQRGQRESSIIEGQLERYMDHVEKLLLAHQLYLHFLVVEMSGYLKEKKSGEENGAHRGFVYGAVLCDCALCWNKIAKHIKILLLDKMC